MIDIREIQNSSDLKKFISDNKNVCVKFSANWCQPCKVLEQRIKNLDSEKINNVLFAEVDVDNEECELLTNEFGITNIPVLLFISDGEVKTKTTGLVSTDDIYKKINEMA